MERTGLLHEISRTAGRHDEPFRWLLETADEFRALALKNRAARDDYLKIAATAVELAVKRGVKSPYALTQEGLDSFFWFMRVEDSSFVNMTHLKIAEHDARHLWEEVDTACKRTLSRSWPEYHPYRREAVFMLEARGTLSTLIPRAPAPSLTHHPWNMLDEVVLQALNDLALRDAKKLGSNSVDYALVHGSDAAAVYVAATHAREAFGSLQLPAL
jgi:phosphoribosylformylglycinamidine (FGAM) synthase PurS component